MRKKSKINFKISDFTHTNLMTITFKKRILIAIFFLMLFLCILNVSKIGSCENLNELQVSLNIDGKEYVYSYPYITYKSGIEEILIKNGKYDVKGRLKSIDKNFFASYECGALEKDLIEIARLSKKEPINASVSFDSGSKKFVIEKEINGQRLDIDKILSEVQNSLNKGKSYKGNFSSDVIIPEVTEKTLKKSLNVRSVFSTDFSSSTPERKNNIALSLKKLDGLIITPNQEISFNEIVGPRTTANGFLKAKIIMDNEFVDGVGGGVCQASTTLYNALLLADISITRYSKHSLKVGYVLPSFDAMVSSASDLKFKNDTDNYIYIRTDCTQSTATVKVYGEKMDYKILRVSETNFTGETPDERRIIDTEGRYSGKVKYKDESYILFTSKPKIITTGYLHYIKDGTIFKIKKLRQDTYNQFRGTVILGNKERPQDFSTPSDSDEKELTGYLG